MILADGKATLSAAVVLMLVVSCITSSDPVILDAATTTAAPPTTMMPLDQARGLVVLVAPECDVCDALVAELRRRAEVTRTGDGKLRRSEIGHRVWIYSDDAPSRDAPTVQVVAESGRVRGTWQGAQALLELDAIITLGCGVDAGVCPYEMPCVVP